MVYSVKEIFYTLQGEGIQAGRAAVFCRFAGCNLWTGQEKDRVQAICQFCDTDFVGTDGTLGGRYTTADALADIMAAQWPDQDRIKRFCVLTGGEPLLQVDEALVAALHARGFEIAVETNGTQAPPLGLDWICVSPKAGAPLKLTKGSELKLVFPQTGAMPDQFIGLDFHHFLLQPMDGPDQGANTKLAIDYIQAHPIWRLSVQTHKFTGIR
jgi:7-carboxy-7-deazaguanine synthase (Cx14CxxC type)